jgi:hypothetical protein
VIGKRTANTRARVVHVIFVILFFIGVSIAEAAVSLPRFFFSAGRVALGRKYYSRLRELSTNGGSNMA